MVIISSEPASPQDFERASDDNTALSIELQRIKQQLVQERSERQRLEAELAKSAANPLEPVFKQLFERSSDAHWLMQDGLFVDCNLATVQMLCCEDKAQLLSLHPSDISPEYQPDGRLSSEKASEILTAVSQHGSARFEWMHRRLTGEDFWAEAQLVRLELNGQPLIHATVRDIDQRQQAEAALRQKEIQYRGIFEAINDGILINDLATGKIVAANPAIVKMHGYTEAEFVQLGPVEFVHPDSMPKFVQFLSKLYAGQRYTCEAQDIRKDGTLVDIEVKGVPFTYNGSPHALAVIRDISDRKAVEQALAKNEAYHRALFDQSSIGLALCRMDGQLEYINAAYCDILGRTPEDVRQLTYWEITPQKYADAEQLQLESLRSKGRYGPYEKEYIHRDGHLVSVRLSGTIVERNGEKFIWSSVEDISDRKAVEDQLEDTNTLLKSVVETIPGFFFAKDLQGRHIALNSNLAEFFGKPISEIIGKTDAELLPPEVAAGIMAKDQEVIRTLTTQRFEEVVPTEGADITYLTVKTPLYDADGQVAGMIGLAQDISNRKEIELALRQSEQRFRDVTHAAGEYIWEITADGVYTFVTEQAKAVKGYAPEELLGCTPFEFMPEEDIAQVEQIVQAAASQQTAFTLEHRDILPDGTIVWESVSGVPIVNDRGEITGFRGTGLSITERKTTEAILAQSEAKFRRLVENAHDLIYEIGQQGQFAYLSPQFAKMCGHSVADFLHKPFAQLVHPDDLPALMQANHRLIETGERQTDLEFRIKRKDGRWIWLMCNNTPMIDTCTNKVIGFHGIARDISDQKQSKIALQQKAAELEATLQTLQETQLQMLQSEKMSSLGQLVAGVAHEINNPVSFIYGNIKPVEQYTQDLLNLLELYQSCYPEAQSAIQEEIEAIELDFLKEDLPKTLASMKMGAERIREIVRSLRTFSRLDEAACKAVDVHQGIDSCLVILEHRLKATDTRLAIGIDRQYGDLPLEECYAGQLNQVLMNILANALDALEECDRNRSLSDMRQSPSTITISTQTLSSERIAIHLTDNGPGMSEAVQARLFDPFFTTKPVGKGTGMGMSISYQIITDHHGGQLTCVSSPGQGTTFIIEIPTHQNIT